MIKKVVLLLLIILMFGTGCAATGVLNERTIKARNKVADAANWFIQEGVVLYLAASPEMATQIVQGFGVSLGTPLLVNKKGYLALLFVESWWMGATARCYERIESEKGVYEYWVLKINSSRAEPAREIYFIITYAKDMVSKRQILARSEKFIEDYETEDGVTISFPKSVEMVDALTPWHDPAAFVGTYLEGKEVIYRNGEPIMIDR